MAMRAGAHTRVLAFSFPKNVARTKSSCARLPGLIRPATRSPFMTRTWVPRKLVSSSGSSMSATKISAGRG